MEKKVPASQEEGNSAVWAEGPEEVSKESFNRLFPDRVCQSEDYGCKGVCRSGEGVDNLAMREVKGFSQPGDHLGWGSDRFWGDEEVTGLKMCDDMGGKGGAQCG